MDAKQFIAGLPAWDGVQRLDGLTKAQLFAAQVKLPVPTGFTGRLAVAKVRRPYHAQTELVTVDVSRLRAP